jgi:hypothetical protein
MERVPSVTMLDVVVLVAFGLFVVSIGPLIEYLSTRRKG